MFTHIAQTSTLSEQDALIAAGLFAVFFIASLIFALISYVIGALCLMQIFKKAGSPAWPAWVPIYNTWRTLEIGGQQGFWAVLALIPFVNIVSTIFLYIAQYHIGLKLGKSGAFVAWAILFPAVWYIWLAVDKSTWNETKTTEVEATPSVQQ